MMRIFGKPGTTLEQALGYRFRNRELLREALTHPSFRAEQPDCSTDNQRLEFLGDAVLGLLTAAWLYARFPHRAEGELTRMRCAFTNGQTLYEIGREMGIGKRLRMGHGEMASGGPDRPSNISDTVEALIGAAWLDGGIAAATTVFESLFASRLKGADQDLRHLNPKGDLQEFTQKRWNCAPEYRVTDEAGPPHKRVYTVTVQLPDGLTAHGRDSGKRGAEARAAEAMLELIEHDSVRAIRNLDNA